jgi:tetratricopeptide (TPR) repeat protein
MRTILALSLSLLAAPALQPAVLAQGAPAAKAAPQPAAAPASPLQAAVQDALKRVRAGDKAGALAKLKVIAADPAATQPELSLVGALYLQLDHPQEALATLKPLADGEDAEPAVLYNAGRAALLTGQGDMGRVYLTRSALKQPASPAARDLGVLMAKDGRVVEAYSMLRPWALRNPTDTDARLIAANLAVQLERPDDAAQLLAGIAPNDPAVRLLNGKVLVLKKDGPGAVALLTPLLANHPQGMELEVRRSLAEAELLAGKPAEAVKLIDGRTAGHPPLALLLARAQRQAGNAAAAAATLKPLADQLPADGKTLPDPRPAAGIAIEYGSLLVDSGHAAEAVPFYEKATRYYANPDAWKGLARAYEASGRKADAQKALAQAAQAAKPAPRQAAQQAASSAGSPTADSAASAPAAAPEEPLSPGLQKALGLMTGGNLEMALTAIRQETAISKDPRARMLEVRILLGLKRGDEALKVSEADVAAEPKNPDYLYLRGISEMSLRRLSSAEQDFRQALQIQPRHLPAMNDLAVLLIQVNKKPEAQKLLEQVLRINPQDQMAAANLQHLKAEAQQ